VRDSVSLLDLSLPSIMFCFEGDQMKTTRNSELLCRILFLFVCMTMLSSIASAQWSMNGTSVYYYSGSVGIGTASPSGILEVNGGDGGMVVGTDGWGHALWVGSSNDGYELSFVGGFPDTVDMGGQIRLGGAARYDDAANIIQFLQNGTERMRVNNGGNVGIGTAAPAAPLHVYTNTSGYAWGGRAVFSGASNAVVAGQYNDKALVAAHNAALNAWATLYVNTTNGADGSNVILVGSGNVGVGTASPQAKLDVAGNIVASGNITASGISATYQDLAEWVPSAKAIKAGYVVITDPKTAGHVLPSSEAYDTRVAGVVSEMPGIVLGEGGDGKVKVATVGRVKVKVDATKNPINIGDLLVSSNTTGVAMKSKPIVLAGGRKIHQPGTLIGKALESLKSGQGEIMVLLSLQ
jgi:hypothetical protein